MKYGVLILMVIKCFGALAQSDSGYIQKMAFIAGVKRPVPQKFAFRSVRRPVSLDSAYLVKFHSTYITTMRAGTGLLIGGTLLVVSHILVAALVPHFNENLVITLATFGVASATAGSIVLPIGASERHRYKKSLRIALAKKGL